MISGALAPGLAAPETTRRQAVAGLVAAAVSFGSLDAESEAKKKKGRRRKKRKNKNKNKQKQRLNNPALQKANVAVGAYIPWALDDRSVLTDFHRQIGRSLDFVIWYEDWESGNFDDGCREDLATYDSWGMTPVIAWHPCATNGHPVNQPKYSLSNIFGGNFDGYIDSWIAGLKEYGKPVYLKFAHEMNGDWTTWGVGVNGNQPGDYRQAWRYIHNRFTKAGVTNVRWVWNPNIAYNGVPATLQDVYPGDEYVDWVGMNGYNWGTSVYWVSWPSQSKWESFSQVFDRTYNQLVALSDKPIFIGEFASSEEGGDKARWISDALLEQLPNKYPRVKAISWFSKIATGLDTNANGEIQATAEVDWRVTSSKAARKAFARAVNTPYYQSTLG
ncbi:MAG: glycoside hydrolase family 26 protein [Chloroflexota bacterium]|nr:glycoside hydrolase family 26 protein [Chloroflexota bacterium]